MAKSLVSRLRPQLALMHKVLTLLKTRPVWAPSAFAAFSTRRMEEECCAAPGEAGSSAICCIDFCLDTMWDIALRLFCGCLKNSTFDLSRREITGLCGCDLFLVIFMACAGYSFCLPCEYSTIVDGRHILATVSVQAKFVKSVPTWPAPLYVHGTSCAGY